VQGALADFIREAENAVSSQPTASDNSEGSADMAEIDVIRRPIGEWHLACF